MCVFRLVRGEDTTAPVPSAFIQSPEVNLSEAVAVGRKHDGEDLRISLHAQTALLAGSPGSGKSVMAWNFLVAAALDPSCVLVVVDCKPSGIETAPIHPRCSVVATDGTEALAAFRRIWRAIEERNRLLLAQELEKVPTDNRVSFPPIVIFVDEAAELSETDDGQEALKLLRRIVSVGRASGVSVILATQKPSSDLIPTSLRDLFATRLCFRVGSRGQAETCLGPLEEGVTPWLISTQAQGHGFALVDGKFQKFRAAYLPREAIAGIAREAVNARRYFLESHGLDPEAVLPADPGPAKKDREDRPQRRRRS